MQREAREYVEKRLIALPILWMIFVVIFFYAANDSLHYQTVEMGSVTASDHVGEIVQGTKIEQRFWAQTDRIEQLALLIATYARKNTGTIQVKIKDLTEKKVLYVSTYDVSNMNDGENFDFLNGRLLSGVKGHLLSIAVTGLDGKTGNAITLYKNVQYQKKGESLWINGAKQPGMLCLSMVGKKYYYFSKYYWHVCLLVAAYLILFCYFTIKKIRKNQWNQTACRIRMLFKYRFLLKQLVMRDFKKKYKRSVLGFFWSFLNPLLTMCVQYFVFSSLFRSNIRNFPVYLLTGSVFFGFFTESVGVGIGAIIDNAALITKVYVPKYIYPITKVLSTSINLLFSMLPLLLMVIITRVPITKSILLLPYGMLCILLFSSGIVLVLSSAMVFFRDTQFLWGILSMIWMYATPIFYPDHIIPPKYRMLYECNPMYHFLHYARAILLDGVAPQLITIVICTFFAGISFLFGMFVFKKTQDQFVLYI